MKRLFLILGLFIIVSCNSNTGSNEVLQLNNGEKWEVNDEMKPHILNSEEVLLKFTNNGSDAYKSLALELEEHNGNLIKSCNMKGESHDELHKWLYPHMRLIESLKESETTEQSMELVEELATSFKTYHSFFE